MEYLTGCTQKIDSCGLLLRDGKWTTAIVFVIYMWVSMSHYSIIMTWPDKS